MPSHWRRRGRPRHGEEELELGRHDARPPRKELEPEQVQLVKYTAPARDLAALPGVGPALASRIVAYRQQHGGTGEEGGGGAVVFRGPQDLDEVKGIGPGALKRLAPYMRFPATQTAR